MTSRAQKWPRLLYVIFILSFLIKMLAGFFLNMHNKTFEIFEYEIIANNMLSGKGFVYNFYGIDWKAFIQPFYTVFTAFVYYLTGHNQIVMIVIQSIISSALCFVVCFIAMHITKSKEALLAALLTALHPGIAVYSILKLHTLVFDIFFYLLSANLILKFAQKPNIKNSILAGSIIGLALLCRSTILMFGVIALIFIFFMLRGMAMRKRFAYILLVCLFTLVVYSPWLIRNYKIFNTFVFMQTSSGENLWAGNNEKASGSAILMSGESIHAAMPEEMRKDLVKLDELGQDRYYKKYFVNFVKNKPLLFTRLFIKKFYYFWWFAPHTGMLYKKSWLYMYKVYYASILLFFIAGTIHVFRTRSNISATLILLIYIFSVAGLHALVNVDTRHRWTVEPVMIIFSSIGFFDILDRFRKNA